MVCGATSELKTWPSPSAIANFRPRSCSSFPWISPGLTSLFLVVDLPHKALQVVRKKKEGKHEEKTNENNRKQRRWWWRRIKKKQRMRRRQRRQRRQKSQGKHKAEKGENWPQRGWSIFISLLQYISVLASCWEGSLEFALVMSQQKRPKINQQKNSFWRHYILKFENDSLQ